LACRDKRFLQSFLYKKTLNSKQELDVNYVHYFLIGIFILIGAGLYFYPDRPKKNKDGKPDFYDKLHEITKKW